MKTKDHFSVGDRVELVIRQDGLGPSPEREENLATVTYVYAREESSYDLEVRFDVERGGCHYGRIRGRGSNFYYVHKSNVRKISSAEEKEEVVPAVTTLCRFCRERQVVLFGTCLACAKTILDSTETVLDESP